MKNFIKRATFSPKMTTFALENENIALEKLKKLW